MSARGPGEPPPVVRRRAARVKRKAQTQRARAQQNQYVSQGKAVQQQARQQRTQRQAQQARSLAQRPVRPQRVKPTRHAGRQAAGLVPGAGQAQRATKPLSPTPVALNRPDRTPKDPAKARRGLAVAAYDQLTGDEKHAHLRQVQKRFVAGKATEGDRVILHAHSTRVAGNRKIARVSKELFGPRPPSVSVAERAGLHLEPGAKAPKNATTVRQSSVVAGVGDIGKALRAIGKASSKGWESIGAPKVIQNAPKDIADLAVTTPSSIAKLATTAATHPKKVPGMLIAPYKQLAKDPKKFAEERPVSTLLMVAPAVRVPGRAAGRAVRATGKHTLSRPAATLPGTTLKQAREGSRGAVSREVQRRRDAKRDAPEMTAAHVQRRVDEFYDFEKHHVARAQASAVRRADERARTNQMTKPDRREYVQEMGEAARSGAKANEAKRKFAREFGAPHVHHEGRVQLPRNPHEGALHDSREAAQAVADHLNAKGIEIERGAHGPHQAARRKTKTPLEFDVRDAGYGQFATVPKIAKDRIETHAKIGKSQALGAREMRIAGRSFRNAVLPLSARWLVGQGGEAGLRAAVARAGPADLVRFNQIVKKMNQDRPGSGDEFLMRVTGGQFDLTGTAREFAHGKSLAEEFKGSAWEDPAHFATKAATTKPALAVRRGWQAYTNVVFNTVNGFFEQNARKAMAGQAIRQGPLMEKHLLGLTDRAIADAAKGLRTTENQVAAGRAVDRMYGQYQKFSPDKREKLLHTTPFYPWYRNMVTFLLQTLPVDHPVTAALTADLDAATEEWRKAHGLSFHGENRKPAFLQGGYPTKSGGVKRVGRYTPFAPADPLEAGADLFLPQYGSVKSYLGLGVDWKGDPIKGSRIKAAAGSLAQAHVPSAGQATRIVKKVGEGKTLGQALVDEIAPLPTTKGGTQKKRHRRRKKKPAGPPSSYPGFDGGSGSGSGGSRYPGF